MSDVDERYQKFLAGLSDEQRQEWNRCVVLFQEKFGPQLLQAGLESGVQVTERKSYSAMLDDLEAEASEKCLCLYAIKQTAGEPVVHDRRCEVAFPRESATALVEDMARRISR